MKWVEAIAVRVGTEVGIHGKRAFQARQPRQLYARVNAGSSRVVAELASPVTQKS
jgi:hypothetical protein